MEEIIKSARQVALDLLKPTQKELEHGLELHANSIVCDTYGFSPRAAVDGDVLKEAVESGASNAEINDMVEEMSMTRFVTDAAERKIYEDCLKAAGVTCVFQNAGVENQNPMQVMKRLARFTYATDMLPELYRRAAVPEDIEKAKKEGKHCLYMSSNAVPLTQQWVSVEEELSYIRTFFQLGVRMMHLTYNRRNMIGDGCAESANAGLSDFGKAVVAEMNRVGVIVDVAHSGWQTSLEAAQVSTSPVVASHAGCLALNNHIRCKPDEVIEAIVDTGGYVGIACIPRFLGRTGDIRALLDHIDYIVERWGADHVTIGTDLAAVSPNAGKEQAKVPKRRRSRSAWENFWPEGTRFNAPEWWQPHMLRSLAWINWPIYTVGMVQRGHSDSDIQKILGGNMLRVAKAALAAKES